jgi:hypothetical protein
MLDRLRAFLEQPSVILETAPSPPEIEDAVAARAGKTLMVMYGETYDPLGPTLDSLKYYFSVATIAKLLQHSGKPASGTILIADVATCRNEPDHRHDEIMEIGKQRKDYLVALSDHFKLGLNILLMSEYLFTPSFQDRLNRIRDEADRLHEVYEWVKQTVPPSKVEIEKTKGFAYAFEEIATIIEYDLKVGPPREKFYDEPTRMIAKLVGFNSLMSVYLHPTYPLGCGFDFFFANEEIEEYGVTAYKAGSKGLSEHRIILGDTSEDRLAALIDESFVGRKRQIPNPVLDLAVIAEMARQWQAGRLEQILISEAFYSGDISPEELKKRALEGIRDHVFKPVDSLLKGVVG